jgi:hypothetical protein
MVLLLTSVAGFIATSSLAIYLALDRRSLKDKYESMQLKYKATLAYAEDLAIRYTELLQSNQSKQESKVPGRPKKNKNV